MDDGEIYDAIGEDGFTRLVAAFYRQIPGDDILGPMYPPEDMAGAEERLRRAFGADEVRFRMLVGKTDTVVLDYLLFGNQKLNVPSVDALADQIQLRSRSLQRL